MMSYKPTDASRGFGDAFQHALGVNLVDVGAWLGPGVAAIWIWSSVLLGHTSGQEIPTPVQWLHEILSWAGISETWTTSMDMWLSNRPVIFWIAILAAVYLAGVENTSRTSMATATWIALLIAASTYSLLSMVLWFVGLTAALTAAAGGLERIQEGQDGFIGAQAYLMMWCLGPLFSVITVLLEPVFVAIAAVGRYRFPSHRPRGIDLGLDIANLTRKPLSEAPTRDVVALLARVLLADDDYRQSAADTIERQAKLV